MVISAFDPRADMAESKLSPASLECRYHFALVASAFQPVQHRSCISGIADKPLRLKAESLLCSLDRDFCRAYLCVQWFHT
jgi:hypothetical protein